MPRTAILRVYHTRHLAPGGDIGQTAPGGYAPRYFSRAYQTQFPGRRHGEVLRAYLPDTVLIVTRPLDQLRAVIFRSFIPDTLPRAAMKTILLSSIPDTLLRTVILRDYTRDTLPLTTIPVELPRAAVHIKNAHVQTRRTVSGGDTACHLLSTRVPGLLNVRTPELRVSDTEHDIFDGFRRGMDNFVGALYHHRYAVPGSYPGRSYGTGACLSDEPFRAARIRAVSCLPVTPGGRSLVF